MQLLLAQSLVSTTEQLVGGLSIIPTVVRERYKSRRSLLTFSVNKVEGRGPIYIV